MLEDNLQPTDSVSAIHNLSRTRKDYESLSDAEIFSLGSDARIAGLTPAMNPITDRNRRKIWDHGWHHANRYWGTLVKGRWKVAPLPPIQSSFRYSYP